MTTPTIIAIDRARSWRRTMLLGSGLLALVLVPFALFGAELDAAIPVWLRSLDTQTQIAAVGILLLVIDVFLPIPSSIVALVLCWVLGPLLGGIAVAAGAFLSFALGLLIGRLLPEARLRHWLGDSFWDLGQQHLAHHAWWWIAIARPLPVLAEVTAMLAGTWRLPVLPALSAAAIGAAAMGCLYGLTVLIGQDQPSLLLSAAVVMLFPSSAWLIQHLLWRWFRNKGKPSQGKTSQGKPIEQGSLR